MDSTTTAPDWATILGYPGATATALRLDLTNWHSVDDQERQQFPAVWGKRIRAIGGRYEDVRGGGKRRVALPATAEGLALAAELIAADPCKGRPAARHTWDDSRPRLTVVADRLWYRSSDYFPPHAIHEELRGHGATLEQCLANCAADLRERFAHGKFIPPERIAEAQREAEAHAAKEAAERAERERRERIEAAAPVLLMHSKALLAALREMGIGCDEAAALADTIAKAEA